MKAFPCYCCVIILLFVSGCNRYNCCVAPIADKLFYATKNNVAWESAPEEKMLTNDTLNMEGVGVNADSNLHDTLSFKIKYNGAGNYVLAAGQAFYHSRVGNGDPLDKYQLDPTFNNIVVVTGFDATNTHITGTFSLRFADPANPAGISFLNGIFKFHFNK